MEIRVDDLTGPEIAAFLEEHIRDMRSVSPPESTHALDLELDPSHGEIKSMRTSSSHRRKGVAAFVLQHILAVAKERGYRRVSLETGSMAFFEPARRLYVRHGFEDCAPFANYREDRHSVFFTKDLTRS
jgi:putative acetyltransferase